MTQMLLFDTPNSTATTVVHDPKTAATDENQPQNIAAAVEHESGLNHMGDLARLVLLRYELVAKRRQAMAARNAK